MNNMTIDLKQAIMEHDIYAIDCFVVDQQNILLNEWYNKSHQTFHTALQRALQKSHRAKQQFLTEKDEIPYQIGVWEGFLQAFRALYEEENTESDILEKAVAKSPNTAKIIRFLYQHSQPICHGELADELGMTHSALSNAMKRVIGCGAVSVSRTGRNTRYTLTAAAKQYCKKEAKWSKVLPKSREMALLEELITMYQRRAKAEDSSVSVGDYVHLYKNGKEVFLDKQQLKGICTFGAEKIIELDSDDDNAPVPSLSPKETLLSKTHYPSSLSSAV